MSPLNTMNGQSSSPSSPSSSSSSLALYPDSTGSFISQLAQLDDSCCSDIIGTLKVDTRRLLNEPFSRIINFTKPIRKGYYSVSFDFLRDMDYMCNASALRYLCCPKDGKVDMDLLSDFDGDRRGGFGVRRKKPQNSPQKNHFLKWLATNKNDLITDQLETTNGGYGTDDTYADIVSSANILKSIMSTPYISAEGNWSIVAIKINGVVYLVESRPKDQSNTNRPPNHQRNSSYQPADRSSSSFGNPAHSNANCYAGLKFKEMVSRRHDGSHDTVNHKGNRDSFWTVCATNVGMNHRVLYNVRTECALDDKQLEKTIDEASFVELKTRPSNINERRWESRAIDWWLGSLLAGTEMIFCGERDRDFHVRKVTKLFVDSLPKSWYKWSPKTCVNFLNDALTFIRFKVTEEMTPYQFDNIDDEVTCTKLDDPVDQFMPTWYIDHTMYEVPDLIRFTDTSDCGHSQSATRSDTEAESEPESD